MHAMTDSTADGRSGTTADEHQQRATWTALDRYPTIFAAAAKAAPKRGWLRPRRVLSYGCSTGEEVHTLATRYFRRDRVVGLDISDPAIETARQRFGGRRIAFDRSSPRTLAKYGPFDLIFAMSVLCRWPQTANLDDCSALYTFDEFAEQVATLDRHLRVGGLLIVYNANFGVLDTPTAQRYEVVKGYGIWKNGFVHRFDRHNKRDESIHDDCIYQKVEAL